MCFLKSYTREILQIYNISTNSTSNELTLDKPITSLRKSKVTRSCPWENIFALYFVVLKQVLHNADLIFQKTLTKFENPAFKWHNNTYQVETGCAFVKTSINRGPFIYVWGVSLQTLMSTLMFLGQKLHHFINRTLNEIEHTANKWNFGLCSQWKPPFIQNHMMSTLILY